MNLDLDRVGITVGELSVSQNLSGLTDSVIDRDILLVYGDGKCTYIDQSGNQGEYQSIREALNSVENFSGNIRFEQDLYQEFETSEMLSFSNYSLFNIYNKNLTFDLNGHLWTIQKNDDGITTTCRFMIEMGNSSVTIKNGTLSCHGLQMLYIYGGEFRLENTDAYSNIRVDIMPQANTKGLFYVDNMSKVVLTYDKCSMYDNDHEDNMAPAIFPWGDAIKSFNGWENYKTNNGNPDDESGIWRFIEDFDEYMPTIVVEGTMISEMGPKEDQKKTCDLLISNGTTSKIPVKFVIGKDAVLKAFNGSAIFLNNCGKIILNGGKIYGRTPIALRSGLLYVPNDANPYVYGTGDGDFRTEQQIEDGVPITDYDPTHDSGKGADMFNKMGNAVVLESSDGYGKYTVLDGDRLVHAQYPRAIIESGEFHSLYKNPIGSFAYLTSGNYCQRTLGFVRGAILGKSPTSQEYVPENGKNSDYGIVDSGYSAVDICEIKKNGE